MPGDYQDFTLKIDGIKGEARGASSKDEIDLESWSFGITQATSFGSGGGGGTGKAGFQDIQFKSRMSCASPKLFDACATGKHIEKAILTCRKAGGKQEVFYTMTLTDVLVSSYRVASLDGARNAERIGPAAIDEFALNFGRIEVAYKEQNVKGGVGASVQTGWDVRKNVKV